MLVDRGRIRYEDPIAKHWPEFGGAGKDWITVRDLMQHRSGLAWLCDGDPSTDDSLPLWDTAVAEPHDAMARLVERSRPAFPHNTRTAYHGVTRDLIVSELFRRVDGRTLGDFIEQEVAARLGVEYHVGVNDSAALARVRPMVGDALAWSLRHAAVILYRYVTNSLPPGPQNTSSIVADLLANGPNANVFKVRCPLAPLSTHGALTSPRKDCRGYAVLPFCAPPQHGPHDEP